VRFIHKVLKVLKNKQFWLPALLLVTGFGLGNLFYAKVLDTKEVVKANERSPYSSLSSTKPELSSKEDVKAGYEQAKKRVDTDLGDKKLSADQATKLKQKIDEIYAYSKDLDLTKKEVRDDLQKKRVEWRKWLHDNNLPLKYITSVYWN
jgi:hypothetical protein